ncbi:MAG: chorismate mutase [Thermaerobacterales bacterium]
MAEKTLRGIRGAISVGENTAEGILEATRELLKALQERNGFEPQDLVSVFFTATPDLTATFPAMAARQLGWTSVPMLGAVEMQVPDVPGRLVRVLVHWMTALPPDRIVHVYLKEAAQLRPDWAGGDFS